jgi:formate dehydrogenase iron-sulfur subunit
MTATDPSVKTLIDELLAEQRSLTAVEKFSRLHESNGVPAQEKFYRDLIPLAAPMPGEQYAFEVNLDQCSGCKACVSACHSLNGLDENETWRGVGMLISDSSPAPTAFQQHVTSACHHCVEPACAEGCPVLAYDKDPLTGIVRHLDDQCIGCQYCVMKCPYDVPKFSPKKGIVRKCDMCASRLAVGEAPACVQACPHEAIKITVVKQFDIRTQFRAEGSATKNSFLPGSPAPQITLPTTRYISKNPLPKNLFSADHSALRLDHAHWPLVFMLVFTQAAAGIFLCSVFAPVAEIRFLNLVAFSLLNLGLMAAPLHLGKPLKAWRAFLGWRKSWLSREIIAFNQFAPLAAAATALAWLPFLAGKFPKLGDLLQKIPAWIPPLEKFSGPLTLGAALVGLGCVFVSGMVYVDTKRPLWSARFSFGNFFGTALLLGATFTALACAWSHAPVHTTQIFVAAALVIRTVLFAWRRLELHLALRNAQSPVYYNARVIRYLLPGTTTARTGLFIASTVFGLLAIGNISGLAPIWAGFAAAAMLVSEIIARYVFFAAGSSKRMPGGVVA